MTTCLVEGGGRECIDDTVVGFEQGKLNVIRTYADVLKGGTACVVFRTTIC